MKKHSTPVDLGVLQRERDTCKLALAAASKKASEAHRVLCAMDAAYQRAVARLQIASKTIVGE